MSPPTPEEAREALDTICANPTSLHWRTITARAVLKDFIDAHSAPVMVNGLTEAETAQTASVVGLSKPEPVALSNERIESIWACFSHTIPTDAHIGFARAVVAASPPPAQPAQTFEQAWAEKEADGYRYGKEPLANVRLGWDMACKAGARPQPAQAEPPLITGALLRRLFNELNPDDFESEEATASWWKHYAASVRNSTRAAQPKREPLSEAAIGKVMIDLRMGVYISYAKLMEFARAIERLTLGEQPK